MITLKKLSVASLFILGIAFTSCTENPHDENPTNTITPGNHADSQGETTHTDSTTSVNNTSTVITPTADAISIGADKNNPDITK